MRYANPDRKMMIILMLLTGTLLVNLFSGGNASTSAVTAANAQTAANFETSPSNFKGGPVVTKPLAAPQVITGCVRNVTTSTKIILGGRNIKPGELLVIPATGVCDVSETILSWNVQGPAGHDAPRKITGYVFPDGIFRGTGFTVTHNSLGHWTISCPAGTFPDVPIPFFQASGPLTISSWISYTDGSFTVDVNTNNINISFWFIIQTLA